MPSSQYAPYAPLQPLRQFNWASPAPGGSTLARLQQLNISREDYNRATQLVAQALEETGLHGDLMHERLGSYEGTEHLYLEIPVIVDSVDQLVRANDRVAALLLGSDGISQWDRIVVNLVHQPIAQTSLPIRAGAHGD